MFAQFFFFSTRLKESGNVNISHYKDCPPRESTHNEVFFSHSPCPPVCLSHFRIFFLLLSLCDTLQLVFQGLLSGRWKNWQKTIFLIKLAGHRSEGLIEKSFIGLLRFGGKPTNFNIIKKKPVSQAALCHYNSIIYCLRFCGFYFYSSFETVQPVFCYTWRNWPTAASHRSIKSPPALMEKHSSYPGLLEKDH